MATRTKKKATKKKRQLAPDSAKNRPGESGPRVLWFPSRIAGVHVNEDTALTLGVVWACIRVISESIASMPWGVFRKLPNGGRMREADNPVDWLLHTQANPEVSAFHFRETIIAHALTWGNGYAEIERDAAGRPLWLWQITPDRVYVERDERGNIVYEVFNPRGGPSTYIPAENMFHLKGLGFDGLVGYSVIRMAAREIGAGMAMQEFGSNYFANDTTPGGILKYPTRLSDAARNNLRESWQKRHGGPENRRVVAILEEGLEWQQTGLPPQESQFIEGKQLLPSEICRWFRVPPHKIQDLSRAHFTNIEESNIDVVTDTYQPWCARLESEANIKLFGRVNRGMLYTKVNLNGLLRGKTKERGEFYATMMDRAILSINDVRELEDLNPIGPDGDKRFVPLNMQLLEKAGEEPPAPEPQSIPEPETDDNTDDEELARQARSWQRVLQDACARALRREKHRREDAVRRMGGDVVRVAVWLKQEFWPEHAKYVRESLENLVSSCAEAIGREARTQLALENFVQLYESELLTRPETFDPSKTAEVHAAAIYREVTEGQELPAVTFSEAVNTPAKPSGAYESEKKIDYNERGWISKILERVTPC